MTDLEPRKQTFLLELGNLSLSEYLVRIINGDVIHYKKLIIE